mmetsp:Transcript_17079/g.45192  ORF Transcript_17079/g.45192 Transcript_17079/m.45192 type:complete len:229 (-) Transcript_17079:245-931(-)
MHRDRGAAELAPVEQLHGALRVRRVIVAHLGGRSPAAAALHERAPLHERAALCEAFHPTAKSCVEPRRHRHRAPGDRSGAKAAATALAATVKAVHGCVGDLADLSKVILELLPGNRRGQPTHDDLVAASSVQLNPDVLALELAPVEQLHGERGMLGVVEAHLARRPCRAAHKGHAREDNGAGLLAEVPEFLCRRGRRQPADEDLRAILGRLIGPDRNGLPFEVLPVQD